MKYLSDAPLQGRLLALPTNIRLGWQYLQETNTLAYYENPKITNKNSFIILGPGPNVIKHFVRNLRIFALS
jgi:hypothetical protein